MDRKDAKLPHPGNRALRRRRRPTKRPFKFPPPKANAEKPLLASSSPLVNGSNLSEKEHARNICSSHSARITSLLSTSSGIGTATGTTVDFPSVLARENEQFSNLAPDFTSSDDNSKVCFNISNFNPGLLAIREENLPDLNGSRLRLRNKEEKLSVNACENENRRVRDEPRATAARQNGRSRLRNESKSRSAEFVLWARDERIELEEITDIDVALHVINRVIERHKSRNQNNEIVDKFKRKMNCKFSEIIAQNRVENKWSGLVQSLARADAEKDRLEYELSSINRRLEAANEYRNKRQKLNSFVNKWRKCSDNLIEFV